MQVLAALVAGFVAGVGAVWGTVSRWAVSRWAATGRTTAGDEPLAGVSPSGTDAAFVVGGGGVQAAGGATWAGQPGPAELARRVLEVARSGAVVLDSCDEVVLANPAAGRMGVLRSGRLVVDEIARLAQTARAARTVREAIVDLPRGRLGREPTAVNVHVAPLDESGHVAVLIDDMTEARRLEAVRRDFVANVSHELKTPVGALTLLAEAVQDAAGDPEAVRRFAGRMQHEGTRLGRLMQELIDLSRLQGADPLPEPRAVPVDRVVAEALDRTALAADTAGITVVAGGESGLVVRGDESQLVTALVNLVDNAIAYSPAGTRVTVTVQLRTDDEPDEADEGCGSTYGIAADVDSTGEQGGAEAGWVEISVRDQGIGIAQSDLERVFERFYRADPARSRATGGTGLGLAIVKHIASNHGGGVRVCSALGSGSTFTLRLPAATSDLGTERPARAPAGAGVVTSPPARPSGGQPERYP